MDDGEDFRRPSSVSIDANAIFFDPNREVLGILGLSWRQDVLRLVDGKQSPGYMPVKNVQKFLAMVRGATQRIKGEDGADEEIVNVLTENGVGN